MEAREKNFIVPEDVQNEEQFIFANLQDINLITAFAAFSAVVITMIAMIVVPDRIDKNLIIYVLIGTSIFLGIFLSVEKLYLNPRFSFFPDIVFVTAITINMYAFKEFADFYFIFYIVLIAVDAFALRMRYFIVITIYMLLAVISYNIFFAADFFPKSIIPAKALMHVYSILITAVVMRFFASKALSERQEKEKIKRLAENTLSAIKNLRALIDNIGDGVFAIDENRNIYTSNTAAINILGWRKAIINRSINEVMPLRDQDLDIVDPVLKVIETGKPYKSSELIIRNNDEEMKLYINIAPILGPMNKAQGAIVIFRDITKEKEIEEQRMEFVAVSSHELRTPLTIIEGYLYNILNNKKLKYDEETRLFMEKAHKSAKDLQNLITDLLDVSKIEQNKISFDKGLFDISDIAKEVFDEYEKKAEEAKLKLVLNIKNKRMSKINMDRARIKEVFINLVGNAIKYSDKGTIEISVDKVDGSAQVSVKDSGIGMSDEDQKYIFDKFYRAENWRTKTKSGTGLGLYITKAIIKNHKGNIWAESKQGSGSTFYFSLPFAKKSPRIIGNKNKKIKNNKSKELKKLVKSI
jgi:PAS domain S-box-containing protein